MVHSLALAFVVSATAFQPQRSAEPDTQRLPLGVSVVREIAKGGRNAYTVTLATGDFFHCVVNQNAQPITATAYRPDGQAMRSFVGPVATPLNVVLVADRPGTYTVVIGAPDTISARYEIKAVELLRLSERLAPQTPPETYRSPRLDALKESLQKRDPGAVEAFWSEIRSRGAPLIEPMEGESERMLVTFLWRAETDVRNVLVVWEPFARADVANYRMTRVDGTDVWYKTMPVHRKARFTYRLSPNDPLTYGPEGRLQRTASAQADPLNSRRWFSRPNSTVYEQVSVLEMPDAPPQPWVTRRPEIPAGRVDRQKFKSELLRNERDVTVYTPPGYRAEGEPYGLLVLFDEGAYLSQPVPTPVILDNLIAQKKIPPLVAVLIGNPDQPTRMRELPPNSAFTGFLSRELMPWVKERYRVTSSPGRVAIGGSSYGGIAAVNAGFTHPELFGNVISQSGSFWWTPERDPLKPPMKDPCAREPNWFTERFLGSPRLPLRFYMDAGLYEQQVAPCGYSILETSRALRDVLRAKGYDVHYQEFAGGHDYLSWRGTLADALIALMGNRQRQ